MLAEHLCASFCVDMVFISYFSFCIPESGIAGSWGISTFNSLGSHQNVLHRVCRLHNPSSKSAAASVLHVIPEIQASGASQVGAWGRLLSCSAERLSLRRSSGWEAP